MNTKQLKDYPVWEKLKQQAEIMKQPENHLKHLILKRNRLDTCLLKGAGMLYDFSHQRIDERTMRLLFKLAESRKIRASFTSMVSGESINVTEERAALHTACRKFSGDPVFMDGKDIMPDIRNVRDQIKGFVSQIHSAALTGSTGKAFRHLVVIGIGGSYLGTEFVSCALQEQAISRMKLYFLSNVDIHNFGRIVSEIEPETTLWIVISKSFTTPETLANARLAYEFMEKKGLALKKHFVIVTRKGGPGHHPATPKLASFDMFDFIGGRYSVTSAVGGVPLSLYLGNETFERFLKGAEEMDRHAEETPVSKNLPLVAALLSVWNNNLLGYPAQAIIPYASPLRKLAPHIQQLGMESNGKQVLAAGDRLDEPAGTIIFGEPGTNAQHSFFQLAHQGRPFPIEFVGVIHPRYPQYLDSSKGVTNHQELWANLIAQATALAAGREDGSPARHFPGNRPSSTIVLADLSPENIGRLLAFYEAKTVFEAFLWGNNPFDQFGVELGKTVADDIRQEILTRNGNENYGFSKSDQIARYYLETLFSGQP
ncbi:MAG: glucose-6-phosphate isomerase [Desulfobacterales bacterium]|nr:glucose-6-phosphate isomerase [Desulfobacterales bacterium]